MANVTTSSFFTPAKPDELVVSVANSKGSFFTHTTFQSVVPDWNKLVGPYKAGSLSQDKYAMLYRVQLTNNFEQIEQEWERIKQLAITLGKTTITFKCWEKDGLASWHPEYFCHRRILLSWMFRFGLVTAHMEYGNSIYGSDRYMCADCYHDTYPDNMPDVLEASIYCYSTRECTEHGQED